MNELELKASIEQTMAEITELLQKSMPAMAKDDEEGGVDDAEGSAQPAPDMDGAPAPEGDASGEASMGADDDAAGEAAEDLGDLEDTSVDGEGDDGMDGRAEVEQMVADMSDDELMLMLEVMQGEAAARGHGVEGEADTGEEASDGMEPDVGQGDDMVEYSPEQETPEEDRPEDMEMSKSGEKGVHKPLDAKRYGPGKSAAGMASPGISKEMHKDKLAELKGMKKPDLGKSEDGEEKDEMKKSIQYLSDTVDMLLAQAAAPAPKAVVPVTKPIAANRPVGQALEKSMPAVKVERLAKSDAIKALIDVQRKEQNVPMAKKTVTSEMVGELHRAQGAQAEQLIERFVSNGLIGK